MAVLQGLVYLDHSLDSALDPSPDSALDSAPESQLSDARLPRRLAAMFYDSLLIIAIWIATISVVVIFVTDGDAVAGIGFQLTLYLETFLFYLLFWRLNGQSLGMQVWKIKLVDRCGGMPTYRQCTVRFLVATCSLCCLGLGFVWMLWDSRKQTWQDRVSGTRIVFLGKDAYKK
jgi:uncharacterized RDD family membrane protein YckC